MSGPDPSVAAVRNAVRSELAPLRRDTPATSPQGGQRSVLVACSGGADSVALAAATAFVAPRLRISAGLVTVDHGLQDGSDARAADVVALGRRLGLDPVEVERVEVGTSGGPEAAARDARYAALDAAAHRSEALLLLGHTLDDQAESVLLGLGRGSGPRSLAGMAPVDGHRVRPLLGLRRSDTRAACAALDLPFWDDPHNTDPAFQRARLRAEVLPLLEDVLQGGVAEALARTADLLRDDADALDAWAHAVVRAQSRPDVSAGGQLDGGPGVVRAQSRPDVSEGGQLEWGLDVTSLADLPRAVRTRVLRAWAATTGAGPLSAERTAALDALVTDWHGQGPIDLPGGVAVRRASGRLEVVTQGNPS